MLGRRLHQGEEPTSVVDTQKILPSDSLNGPNDYHSPSSRVDAKHCESLDGRVLMCQAVRPMRGAIAEQARQAISSFSLATSPLSRPRTLGSA
ncbi:unnamed protein product [Prorocentrum cordatum]|uniref:Uncharacterized protein n=1 Tax=Prorocentrum cordatum TaxID=2364126 RepID=A0ABN9Y1X6_9DINO|nr:unnamed protein product [Polarella glacialis]